MDRRRLSIWADLPKTSDMREQASELFVTKRRTVRQDLKPNLLRPKSTSKSSNHLSKGNSSFNNLSNSNNSSLESQIFIRSSFKLASIYELQKPSKGSSANLLARTETPDNAKNTFTYLPIVNLVFWHHILMGLMLISQYLGARLEGPLICILAYFLIAGLACDIGRYLTICFEDVCVFIYLSVFPQMMFEYLSQKSPFESLFWFIGVNLIICQTDSQYKAWVLLINLLLYNSIHTLANLISYSPALCSGDCDVPKSMWFELILMFLISGWLSILFHFLQRVIRLNAFAQIEREKYMKTLMENNQDLKKQLRSFLGRKDAEENTSPLEKVLTMIKDLISKSQTSLPRMANILLEVLEDLSSNSLLMPQIEEYAADIEIRNWLTGMLDLAENESSGLVLDESDTIFIDKSLFNTDFVNSLDIEVKEYLETLPAYDFDVLHLDKLCKGHALYYLVLHLFVTNEINTKLNIPHSILMTWSLIVEKNYKVSNSYHNALHAADVVQSMYFFLSRERVKNHLSVEDMFACIVACAFHDYKHPGVNNSFLMTTNNPLAQRYNDQSILENFHCASLYEILSDPSTNILVNCNSDQKKYIRELIIGMIMSTDMTFHYDSIGKFKSKMNGSGLSMESRADKKLLLNTAIKCADINNSAKPLHLSQIWCQLIMEEFFAQGAEEKQRNLPISPFMDPENTDIPKCQAGFIEFIVQPLYDTFALFMLSDINDHMAMLQSNKNFWKSCAANPSNHKKVEIPKYEKSIMPFSIAEKKIQRGITRRATRGKRAIKLEEIPHVVELSKKVANAVEAPKVKTVVENPAVAAEAVNKLAQDLKNLLSPKGTTNLRKSSVSGSFTNVLSPFNSIAGNGVSLREKLLPQSKFRDGSLAGSLTPSAEQLPGLGSVSNQNQYLNPTLVDFEIRKSRHSTDDIFNPKLTQRLYASRENSYNQASRENSYNQASRENSYNQGLNDREPDSAVVQVQSQKTKVSAKIEDFSQEQSTNKD